MTLAPERDDQRTPPAAIAGRADGTRSATSEPTPVAPAALRHSAFEDVAGLLTGTFVVSLGIHLLDIGGAVTGGTPGLGLLVGHAVDVPFGVLYLLVNAPFLVLAYFRKGWRFTLRSLLSVALVSAFSALQPRALPGLHPDAVYAVVVGNLLVGIGLLVLVRHRASLGGYTVVALLAQERRGWRAGYVQMGLDLVTVLLAATVTDWRTVGLSLVGAVVVNLVLALNHRPGRYLGV